MLPSAVAMLPQVRDRLLPLAADERTIELPMRVTMADAIDGVVVRTVVHVHGEKRVLATLMMALAETVDSMNCTQPASKSWIKLFANDWIGKYPTETLEDFVFFLEGLRTGKYGPLYNGRVDGARLFQLFGNYLIEKSEQRERSILREREEAIIQQHAHFAEAQMNWEEKQKLNEQVDGLKRIATTAALDRATTENPKTREHRTAGFKAVEDAQTDLELYNAMSTYPYDEVQQAIHEKATRMGWQLPTREEFITAARERARQHRH